MVTTLVSFVFFTALVGAVTYLIVRGQESETSEGYFLAGRSLGAGVIAGSLLLTNLSTEQLVGLNGAAFKDGLAVMAWEVIAGVSLVFMAIFFLPRYLARGITTIPEFLANRFDNGTRAITNAVFIFAYTVILLPIILYSGATGLIAILDLQNLLGIESYNTALWATVWLIGIIGSIYAIFGGLRTVAISDTLNGFGLLIGGLMIAYLGLKFVGDGDAFGGFQTMRDAEPERFSSLGGKDSSVPWPTLFTGVLLLNMFYWTTNQQIIQRTFAAKSLAEGQKGVLLAAALKVFAPLILVLPGMMAFYLDGQSKLFDEGAIAGLRDDAQKAYEGLEVEMIRGDEVLQDAENEIWVAKDTWMADTIQAKKNDRAYGALVRKVLPSSMTGFFAAVMVGAILSSFNSALNATSTLFSLGFYRRYLSPTADDAATVKSGQLFGTIIAVAAMVVAPLLAGQESIFGYLQKMNGLYFIPIFAVVLTGMLNRRVPAWAANLSLIAGFAMIASGYFVFPDAVDAVHEFHFLGIVFALLVVFMWATSLAGDGNAAMTAAEAPADYVSPIPMDPWKGSVPAGVLLVILVSLIYGYFALT